MLNKFFQNKTKPKAMIGLEIHKENSGLVLHGCELALKGKYLKLLKGQVDLKNVIHFSKHFKKGALTLCFTGNRVITKETTLVTELNQQLINTIFPNANLQQFYFQKVDRGAHSYLSIIRRQEVDDLLSQLGLAGFEVMVICLDSFVTDDVVCPSDAQFDKKLLPAYASAFQMLIKNDLVSVDNEDLQKKRINFFAKAKALGIISVSACLFLLIFLLNLMLYSYYADLGQTAAKERNLNVAEVDKFQQQEAIIAKRVVLIKSIGWTGGLKFAYLIDRILGSKPYGIRLSEISVNPILELNRIGQNGSDSTRLKTISVTGISKEAGMVNNWIFALRENSWLADCQIINYSIRQEDEQANFSLNILLKDHEE